MAKADKYFEKLSEVRDSILADITDILKKYGNVDTSEIDPNEFIAIHVYDRCMERDVSDTLCRVFFENNALMYETEEGSEGFLEDLSVSDVCWILDWLEDVINPTEC